MNLWTININPIHFSIHSIIYHLFMSLKSINNVFANFFMKVSFVNFQLYLQMSYVSLINENSFENSIYSNWFNFPLQTTALKILKLISVQPQYLILSSSFYLGFQSSNHILSKWWQISLFIFQSCISYHFSLLNSLQLLETRGGHHNACIPFRILIEFVLNFNHRLLVTLDLGCFDLQFSSFKLYDLQKQQEIMRNLTLNFEKTHGMCSNTFSRCWEKDESVAPV